VLLVDDTPEIAELLTFALRERGFNVVSSSAYDTRINELIAEHRADALVIDCSVFEMSESLFDTVRAGGGSALPVVIISDTPEKADASLRSREAERVLLIPKPFTGSQVARALSELIEERSHQG
jgi:DNA-binding response OmpR family regulator